MYDIALIYLRKSLIKAGREASIDIHRLVPDQEQKHLQSEVFSS
jgi:hypothetical protein